MHGGDPEQEPRRARRRPFDPGAARPRSATPTSTPASPPSARPPTRGGPVPDGQPRRRHRDLRGPAVPGPPAPRPGGPREPSSSPSTPSSTARSPSSRSWTDHADDPDSRSRFLLEAEITGGLEHPGIVPVYGLGHHADGRPYYAMRFIRGDSLKEAIAALPRRGRPAGRPRPPVAGPAEAPPAVPRRLQRDRVRPQPGRPPPRPQAGQHHGRQARRDPGRRLGPGQADRPGRARPRRPTSGA